VENVEHETGHDWKEGQMPNEKMIKSGDATSLNHHD
jgi:hypothetical protein